MKAPTRPLSLKRAAEGLLGRVRRARLYVLSQAAGAAPSSSDHEPCVFITLLQETAGPIIRLCAGRGTVKDM
jgi:hypothetical protein